MILSEFQSIFHPSLHEHQQSSSTRHVEQSGSIRKRIQGNIEQIFNFPIFQLIKMPPISGKLGQGRSSPSSWTPFPSAHCPFQATKMARSKSAHTYGRTFHDLCRFFSHGGCVAVAKLSPHGLNIVELSLHPNLDLGLHRHSASVSYNLEIFIVLVSPCNLPNISSLDRSHNVLLQLPSANGDDAAAPAGGASSSSTQWANPGSCTSNALGSGDVI